MPENDKIDCSTNKCEEYSFCESVTECPNPPNENISITKKTLTRLTKTKTISTNN